MTTAFLLMYPNFRKTSAESTGAPLTYLQKEQQVIQLFELHLENKTVI